MCGTAIAGTWPERTSIQGHAATDGARYFRYILRISHYMREIESHALRFLTRLSATLAELVHKARVGRETFHRFGIISFKINSLSRCADRK
jgi:hypothetical protein